jgi:DNA-directed RNA polymerase subunit RPC12/RpoP
MTIRFACPTCSKPIEVPDDQAGEVTGCMGCEERVRAPEKPADAARLKTANVWRPERTMPKNAASEFNPYPAIVPCRDCGGKVSRTAYNCPHCGARLRHQPVSILSVVLLVLIAISFIPAILALVVMFGAAAGAALKH